MAATAVFRVSGATTGTPLDPGSADFVRAKLEGRTPVGRVTPLQPESFAAVATVRRGDRVQLPVTDREVLEGIVNLSMTEADGTVRVGGSLATGKGSFSLERIGAVVSGLIQLPEKSLAFQVEQPAAGVAVVREVPLSSVICFRLPRMKEAVSAASATPQAVAPPILNSRPGAIAQLYLDFDGETVTDPKWNGGTTIVAAAPNLSAADITEIFSRVKEDYLPFNINLTTDVTRYNNAPVGKRMRCIITPTDTAAPGTGGAAYIDSFSRSGSTFSSTIPCWVFRSSVIGISAAIPHETGHTLGLNHDGRTVPSEEYFAGHGTGTTTWAPLMGDGPFANVIQWSKGEYANANNKEDDLAIISRATNGFGYIADDAGNSATGALSLPGPSTTINQSGVIASETDDDFYSFITSGGTVSITATSAGASPNLDLALELQNSAQAVIMSSNPVGPAPASVSASLAAGTYYVKVSGSGALDPLTNGYSKYGSIGAYTLTGTGNFTSNRPTVTSPTFADVAATSATLGGTVASDSNSTITERGVVYAALSTNSDPVIGGPGVFPPVTASGTTGPFTVYASGLSENTSYAFKAYATNSLGTSYSPGATFTTGYAVFFSDLNGAFESPVTAAYQYHPAISATQLWTFNSQSGVANNSGPGFNVVGSPNGQYAFLQGNGASMSQAIYFSAAGVYDLSYHIAGRDGIVGGATGGDATFSVTIGDLTDSGNTYTGMTFADIWYAGRVFNIPSAGTYTLTFTNTSATGDYTCYFDDVHITRPPVSNTLTIATNEDTAGAGTVSGTDPDGDAIIGFIAANPLALHGRVIGSAVSTLTAGYIPDWNYSGSDTFGIRVYDSYLAASTLAATASVTVASVNDAPSFTLPLGAITGSAGATWTARGGGVGRFWRAIACSSSGTNLVALDNGGPIYTSPNSGVHWTARASHRSWQSVASSDDGTKLAAVVNSGLIYTSTDSGANWTARGTTSRSYTSIASSGDGTKLVAASSGYLYTSTDSGVNWTQRATSRSWTGVASSSNGINLVAVASGGQIYTSADAGVNWTARDGSRSWKCVASSTDGTQLVAGVATGFLYTSSNAGVTWTQRAVSKSWQSVASSADGTKLIAAPDSGQLYTSLDAGVNWVATESSRAWRSVSSSADGTKLAAVVNNGDLYTSEAARSTYVLTVASNAGAITITPFATASAGPANESGQTLQMTISGNTNPALFNVAPSFDSAGALKFTPLSTASGSATLTTYVSDSGGDTSATQTFTIVTVAAPTVTAISPAGGSTAGGTSVTITGTNLTGATAVTIGGTAATNVTVVNATTITATTPAHAGGAVNVAVTTADGTSTGTNFFTYGTPPTVTAISPASGSTLGGTSVTITGTNLTGATAVTVGGTAATNLTVVNATTITATTPAHAAGAVNVAVTTAYGTGTGTGLFTYVAPTTVTAISPTSGSVAGGTSVTITGTNLTGATSVTIGGTAATNVTVVNATTITATAPARAAGAVDVAVTTAYGTGTGTSLFTYVAPPTVTAISPASGSTLGGMSVTITGTNVTGATSVIIGGTTATNVTVVNATTITATTPAHAAGAVDIAVTTAYGTGTGTSLFTYVAPPTVTAISPASGSTLGGMSVTITGTNVTGTTSVTIGGTAATSVAVVNATTITATTPAHTVGIVDVAVTNAGGTGTGINLFTYIVPPTVTAISPASGNAAGGTSVTITGMNLAGATSVTVGGTVATNVAVVDATTITATTPAHATGTVSVAVTTAGGTGTGASLFTYFTVPGAPVIGTATAGNASASVAFTAPASNGGSAITLYTATSSPGGFMGTNTSSPIAVGGLTNGTAYTFTVAATNAAGTGSPSSASNSVSPQAQTPGSLDPTYNPTVSGGSNYVATTAVQPDGKTIIAGNFTTVGGATHTNIARLNTDGSVDASFTASTDGDVNGVAVQADGKLVLGGNFQVVNGTTGINRIARLNADGTRDTSFNPGGTGTNGIVFSVAVQADGRLVLGGGFTSVNGTAGINRIARLNADGTPDTAFNPSGAGASSTVFSVAVQADGKLVLGGSFTSINGTAGINRIARLNADGTLDTAFNVGGAGANNTVFSVAVQADGKLVFGGQFTSVNGTAGINLIARFNFNGTLDTAFNPGGAGASSTVYGVAVQADGKLMLGGNFASVNGTARSLLARLNNDAAIQTLSAPDTTQVLWSRGGAGPEVSQVTFEQSTNGGATYAPLSGTAVRVSGTSTNWQLTGLSLPASGTLRARGRTSGGYFNGSSGLIEQVTAFTASAPVTAPAVATNAASSVTTGGATLNGTVSSNGAATDVTFQYSTNATLSSGVTPTSPAQNLASGASSTAVNKVITGLAAHTQYYFRASGVNTAGTTNGTILNFTTGNTAPTAPNGTATGTTGDQKTVTVTFPATDADGDAVAITSAAALSGLTVNSFTGTSVTFTPSASFKGSGSFTYTVGDGSGTANASATGTIAVTVTDNDAPAITAHQNAGPIEATGPGGATVTYAAATATDNSGAAPTITYSQASGSMFAIGTTTVTITATDAATNASSSTFTVTVADTTAPVVTPPGNVTVHATSPSGAAVAYAAAGASDAVGVVAVTYSTASGALFANGTTTVTVTARDGANNAGSGAFTVTVTPLTAAELWRYGRFGSADATGNAADNADPDRDGIVNLIERAFDTDPMGPASGTSALQYAGTFAGGGTLVSQGTPRVMAEGSDVRALFIRRSDYAAQGLDYVVEFSANLGTWQASADAPTVLADTGSAQVVSVPYPALIAGQPARFFRVVVNAAP